VRRKKVTEKTEIRSQRLKEGWKVKEEERMRVVREQNETERRNHVRREKRMRRENITVEH
jgi:hypothetical protein